MVSTKETPRIVDAFGMPGLFVTRFSVPWLPILANAYMLCGPFLGREANDGRKILKASSGWGHDARLCGVSWMPQALLFDSAPHFHFELLPTSPFVLSNSFFFYSLRDYGKVPCRWREAFSFVLFSGQSPRCDPPSTTIIPHLAVARVLIHRCSFVM